MKNKQINQQQIKIQFRRYLYFNQIQKTTLMISRFLPTVGNLLHRYSQVPLFLFSRQAVKQRNFNREALKIQNCYGLSDAVRYLAKNPEVNEEEFRELSKRVYNSNNPMRVYENISPFVQRFYKVDIQACNLETLAFISGIVPTLNLHRKLKYTKIQQIQKRIQRALLQQKQIKDYQLLAFIQFETQVSKKRTLSNKLWAIYKDRLSGINIKAMDKFFKFISRVKQPQKIQKQIFSEVIKKVKDSLNQNFSLPNKNLIKIYHYVNRMNSNVYYVQNIVPLLEKKIKQRLDDLQISEVIELIKFGNENENKFIQIATKKIFDMINQNGQSDIGVDVIFKVLGIIQRGLNSRLGEERQKKLVQLILKNLQRSNDVISFIEKKAISNSNVLLIHQKILESEYKNNYMENLRYIQQLVLRNQYRGNDSSNAEDLSQAIKLMKSRLNENKTNTNNLIMIGNIVAKLNNLKILEVNSTDENKTNLGIEFKQLKNLLEQTIKLNIKDLSSFKKFIQNTLVGLDVQPFHRKYHHFYEKLIEESIQKQNINEIFILYFIKANDFSGLKKILEITMQKQDNFSIIIDNLIKKLNNNPREFAEHYDVINYGIKFVLKSSKKLHFEVSNSINNYLTNWQTHWMICPNSVHSFLSLAIDFINQEQNFIKIDCFADYFINSPNFVICNSQRYVDLLKAIQNRMINYETKKQKEQTNQTSKQNSWVVKYSTIIRQLRDYNIIDPKIIELLKTSKDPSLAQYAYMASGQFEKYQFELDQRTLISLFRFKGSNPQYSELLENKKKQIQELIASARVHILEAALFNFEQFYEKNGSIFFNQILNICGQNMYYSKRRIHAVFKKIQQKKFFTQDTNKFLQKLVIYYGRIFQRIPYDFHQQLISQCLHRNIKIEIYLTKALRSIQFKFKSRQTLNNKKIIKWLILGLQKGMTLINSQLFKKLQNWEKTYILEFASLQKLNEKQVSKISETLNSDSEFSISAGTLNRFKKINEVFEKHSNKLGENKTQKQIQAQLHQTLVDFLNENQIKFEVGEVQEYKYIKIGETYGFILHRLYTGRANEVFQNYFSEALQIGKNNEKGKLFVILKSQRLRNKNFVNILALNFPELKNFQEKLIVSLQNKKVENSKAKEQAQSEQKKQN